MWEQITSFSIPLPYVLGGIASILILMFIRWASGAIVRDAQRQNLRSAQRRQVDYTFNLNTGHKVQFRRETPYSDNYDRREIFYGKSDAKFEDFTYWGRLVDESTPTTKDWEVWQKMLAPAEHHVCLQDEISQKAAQDLIIRKIKKLLGGKTDPRTPNSRIVS